MRMPTYDKLNSYFTYLKHVDDMPIDMCLVAAKNLFQGESCLQSLTFAEHYYSRYLAETDNPERVDFLEELKINIPVINEAKEMYYKGRYDIVLKTLEPLSKKNYGIASLYIARALAKTNPMQEQKCNQYFIKAAVLGSAYAAYYLGIRLLSGKANELVEPYQIQSEAISYLQLSFNFGYTYAGIYLATLFEQGTKITKNLQNALEVYQKVQIKDPTHAEKIAELKEAIAKEEPKSPFLSPVTSKLLLDDSASSAQPPATPFARARKLNIDDGASAAYSPFEITQSNTERSPQTPKRIRLTFGHSSLESPEQQQSPCFWLSKGNQNGKSKK